MVQEILAGQAPIPLRNLGREVANPHGWQRTGRRLMERVERAMRDAELHDEFGVPFVWAAGTNQARSPFRGLQGRLYKLYHGPKSPLYLMRSSMIYQHQMIKLVIQHAT